MKALIVDDEAHVIEAVTLLVPWQELGIDRLLTAGSVAGAIAIIGEHRPEIVITDIIMADQTGMDLIRWIGREAPATKVIAISGYNDFQYVRGMLTSGSVDYLLKPIEANSLVSAVRKAIGLWREEFQKSQDSLQTLSKMNFLTGQYVQRLLYRLITEPDQAETFAELKRTDQRFETIRDCAALYYDHAYLPVSHPAFAQRLAEAEEAARRRLAEAGTGVLMDSPVDPGPRILLLFGDEKAVLHTVQEAAARLFDGTLPGFFLGCGGPLPFPRQIAKAYEQAKAAFFTADTQSQPERVRLYSQDGPEAAAYPAERENGILSALLSGNGDGIRAAVSGWVSGLFPGESIPLYLVRNAYARYRDLLVQWASILGRLHGQAGRAQEPGFRPDALFDENFRFSPRAFADLVAADVLKIVQSMKSAHESEDLFQKIAYHMELNYAKRFSQAEYAKMFFLNKDYMCRKFKKIMGISMVSHLNSIRIEYAKKLLKGTTQSQKIIAGLVGYEDEKYFTKQFKAITGLTPGQYRNRREA